MAAGTPIQALSRQSGPSRLGMLRMLDGAPTGVLVFSTDGQILFANLQAERLFGLPRALLLEGTLPPLYVQPGDHEKLQDAFNRTGIVRGAEARMRRVGAADFMARMTWDTTQFNGRDAIVAWLHDISARNEERLKRVFNDAPWPMLLCAHPSGDIQLANSRATELFKVGGRERTTRLHQLIGRDAHRAFTARLREGGCVEGLELVMTSAYGETLPVFLSGQVIQIGEERCVLVGISDVTDLKRAEDTLRRFFEGAPLAMLLIDSTTSEVLQVNRRGSELVAPTSLSGFRNRKGKSLDTYVDPEAAARFHDKLAKGGFVDDIETQFTTDYGMTFWALLSGQAVQIGDDRRILVGIQDITETKRNALALEAAKEDAERATQAKTMFLATMSHEIRTPMNGVLGLLEVLQTTPLDDEQTDMVGVIRESARTLLTIIDDILDLSKIEAGKLDLEKIALPLRATIEATVEMLAHRAREKHLELAWRVDPALPEHCLGDPVRLRQILINLIGNAVKFTETGSVSIVATLEKLADQTAIARFEVTDTGIGMSDEQCARLFSPFTQAEASTRRRFGGTGLGLSICRRLVEMMGGQIDVTSAVGAGSTFWFTVPFGFEGDKPLPPIADLSGVAVMLVDDHPHARRSATDILEANGATVRAFAEFPSARAALAGGAAPDVLILDSHEKLAETLDAVAPFLPGRAVLLATAGRSEALAPIQAERELGGVLAKPMRQGALVRAVGIASGRIAPNTERARPQPVQRIELRREEALFCGQLILVAEDNPTNRIVISKQLDKLGFSYDLVENGEEAWQALQHTRYGLLLTDCFMPVLDGYELTRRIRDHEEAGHHLPIVALTANALQGDAEMCLNSGMDDYLSKPVSIEQLSTVLEKTMPLKPGCRAASPSAVGRGCTACSRKAQSAEPPVDLAALAALIGDDDRGTLLEILGFFVDCFPESRDSLAEALTAKDRTAIRNAAHAGKGAARNACAPALAEHLETIETTAATASLKDLKAKFLHVRSAFEAVERFVQAENAPG